MAQTLADILAKGSIQDNSLDRRSKIAERLLNSGTGASNPLIAALTSAVGAYQMGDIANDQKKLEDSYAEQATKPSSLFEGNGMDAQVYNILSTSDPTSKAYKIAYNYAAQPKTQVGPDGSIVTTKPDLSAFTAPGGVQATSSPTTVADDGSMTTNVSGVDITRIPGNLPSVTDKSAFKKVKTESASILNALDNLQNAVTGADTKASLSAAAGGLNKGGMSLNSAWTNAALLSKGQSLYDLGVLNGPDLEIIRKALPDPSTVRGLMTNKEAYKIAIDGIRNLIANKLQAYEANYGTTPPTPAAPGAIPPLNEAIDQGEYVQIPPKPGMETAVPAAGIKRRKFNPQTGRLE